jgi:hypothetical protein
MSVLLIKEEDSMQKAVLTQSPWQENVIFLWNEKKGSGKTQEFSQLRNS